MALTKKQLNLYLDALEAIKTEFPQTADRVNALSNLMEEHYGDSISYELERQRFHREQKLNVMQFEEEFKKVEDMKDGEYMIVLPADKTKYRSMKKAVAIRHPERKFTMRFFPGVGTVLTRVR